MSAAIDSGSVANVLHPADVPDGVQLMPNTNQAHFVGANNSRIENFGTCKTAVKGAGAVDAECDWTCAEVARPLHSVSKLAGPVESPRHDVLFNASKCVVVPPGIVDRILQHVKPLMQYERRGGLYVAEVELSGFQRPGVQA